MTRADIRAHLVAKGWKFEEWELDQQLKDICESNQISKRHRIFYECDLFEEDGPYAVRIRRRMMRHRSQLLKPGSERPAFWQGLKK